MKTLKQYIKESILDDEDELGDLERNIKDIIKQFLKDNYLGDFQYKISNEPNKDGKYIVDCEGYMRFFEFKLPNLVNEYFVFGEVTGNFKCYDCKSLTSLKGAPEVVDGDFYCYGCDSLTSLKGAPEKVGGDFNCNNCKSLKSLEDAPKEVGGILIAIDVKNNLQKKMLKKYQK